jgi:hypothetical protein
MDAARFWWQRRSGGDRNPWRWEFGPIRTWQQAPAPGQVGRRLIEGFTGRELPDRAAWPVSTFMHWSCGAGWAALFGVVEGSACRARVRSGPPFGALVWASGYLTLPIAGLYKPIWKYDVKTLAVDLSGHLAYGTGTSIAFRLFRNLTVRNLTVRSRAGSRRG